MVIRALVEDEYRTAFEEFSRAAQHVQLLTEKPTGDRKAFETALFELEKAHMTYNVARDAFVRSLLPATTVASINHRDDYGRDVETIAELLWEGAGRPTGTAEEDWQRAEAIVKCAVAATAVS